MNILFSVITINYNHSEGLSNTISSIIKQSNTEYELIIIDGGSNDKSINVIEANLKYITYWESEKDNGIYHAMNKGLKVAKGKYCIFMNSGDIFANNDVLENVKKLILLDTDVLYGCHLWGSIDGERWNPKKDFRFRDIITHTPISHQATFVRRALIAKVGGFKDEYKIIADWGVIIDLLLLNAKFQKVSLDICIAEEAGASLLSEQDILKERDLYLKRHHFGTYFLNKYIILPLIRIKNRLKNNRFVC